MHSFGYPEMLTFSYNHADFVQNMRWHMKVYISTNIPLEEQIDHGAA